MLIFFTNKVYFKVNDKQNPKRKVRRCEMKRFFKLGLLFSIGIFIYLKELIAALLILKLTNFETALIFSISLLASTINLKHNKNLFSFVDKIIV